MVWSEPSWVRLPSLLLPTSRSAEKILCLPSKSSCCKFNYCLYQNYVVTTVNHPWGVKWCWAQVPKTKPPKSWLKDWPTRRKSLQKWGTSRSWGPGQGKAQFTVKTNGWQQIRTASRTGTEVGDVLATATSLHTLQHGGEPDISPLVTILTLPKTGPMLGNFTYLHSHQATESTTGAIQCKTKQHHVHYDTAMFYPNQ